MNATKIVVVSHYEHIGTITDGADMSQKIEEALNGFSSDEWSIRSAETAAHTAPDQESDWRPNTTFVTTIILDKINLD